MHLNFRNARTIHGEDERIGSTGSHQNRNKGELVTVSETDTGAIPAKGGALVRGLSVGRVGTETARFCRPRKKRGTFIMPGAGSIASRMKVLAVRLRR